MSPFSASLPNHAQIERIEITSRTEFRWVFRLAALFWALMTLERIWNGHLAVVPLTEGGERGAHVLALALPLIVFLAIDRVAVACDLFWVQIHYVDADGHHRQRAILSATAITKLLLCKANGRIVGGLTSNRR